MAQFIFTYHGGQKPDTPEAGKEAMEQWKVWAAGLGAALINPDTPVGATKILNNQGVSDEHSPHPLMVFSILEATIMDETLELLKDCPHIHLTCLTMRACSMYKFNVHKVGY